MAANLQCFSSHDNFFALAMIFFFWFCDLFPILFFEDNEIEK